jgi:erythronate-4-phosphate dehydrogenase
MKIVADSHIPFVKEYFSAYGELILKGGRTISHDDVKDADILLVRSVTHVDEKLLAKSRVKFVGSVTAGADHLDTKWLDEVGIAFSVAKGFNAPPVADYVVSVIAALQRKHLLTSGGKAAVIGVGSVGRLVVERLTRLGMQVVLCDPLRRESEHDFISMPLDDLGDIDLISLHVPLAKTGSYPTYHFIDKHFLQRQKPGSILLNASRGSVINSKELLQHGMHLHWCFDVWEHEPKIDKAILAQALIATPHIAGYSVQSKIRGIDMIYHIACKQNIIQAQPRTPLTMLTQELAFAGAEHHWQDMVLGVFNPLVMTAMMKTLLLPAEDYGHVFDDMRNQFNYRHEFAYTRIAGVDVSRDEAAWLQALGLSLL